MNDACGCGGSCGCGRTSATGTVPGTPASLPGDPVRFRYGAILERLLDRIAASEALGERPLATLGRSTDDPSVALLAAAAGAHHVLAGALHRLAVDSTLPRTEDRDALLRLVGMLGHLPRPAIAAQALLDVRVGTLPGGAEAAPALGMPDVVTVPSGLTVASVPEQGAQPVTFETDAALEARAGWNSLIPLRPLVLPHVSASSTRSEVEGVSLGARVGDRVLVRAGTAAAGSSSWLLARVTGVEIAAAATPPRTVLTLAGGQLLSAADQLTVPSGPGTVVLLGGRAQAFGATAPDITFMPDAVRTERGVGRNDGKLPVEWRDFVMGTVAGDTWTVHLDAVHPEAGPGRLVVLETGTGQPAPGIARISAARETARSAFGLSARCTVVTLGKDLSTNFNQLVRDTTIHVETGRGTLLAHPADPVLPITDPGPDGKPAAPQHPHFPAANLPDRLYLAGDVALPPGRRVILTGRSSAGPPLTEAATVRECTPTTGGTPPLRATLLVLDKALAGRWTAATLVVLGNVVPASDARSSPSGPETLGSGDPAVPLPRYPLRRAPLAHVAAPGPTGHAPAIEVRVADRRYDVIGSLYGEGADSRRYRVVERPDGTTEVQFAGRLPSGAGNVVASYRSGGGAGGNLPAGRLTQILTPVVGLGSVSNPMPAEGGSDAESLADLRTAAPKAIRTLDRAVALTDFEAFAEAYRGVGRATAVELRTGVRRTVCVTIATTTSESPLPGSQLVSDVHDALVAAAPPGTHVRVAGFVDLLMTLVLALATDPALPRADVEDAIRQALVRDLGRRVRPFGTAVHRSQVLATVHTVPGVVGAVLTTFSAGDPPDTVTEDAAGRLPCPGPALVTDPVSGIPQLRPARRLSAVADRVTFQELTR
jgi:Baseplate J-like protein